MATKKAQKHSNVRTAIVCGGARTIWRDLANAEELFRADAIFCVNDIGSDYPERIDFWCTLHPEKFRAWQDARKKKGGNSDYVAYAHEPNVAHGPREGLPRIDKWLDFRYPGMTGSGSSGLFAVKCAQSEGFNRIVLCGVPMQVKAAHYFDTNPWNEHGQFVAAWQHALVYLRDTVRSMSGWTRELLGPPSPEWLAGGETSNSGAE
jgi:hypothetical protein